MLSQEQVAQYQWRCRRGMLELDLILERFLKNNLQTLDDAQLKTFDRFLLCQDPDLYAWLMGYASANDQELADFVQFIRKSI